MKLLADGVRFTPPRARRCGAGGRGVKGLHVNFANREYHFWSRVWVE